MVVKRLSTLKSILQPPSSSRSAGASIWQYGSDRHSCSSLGQSYQPQLLSKLGTLCITQQICFALSASNKTDRHPQKSTEQGTLGVRFLLFFCLLPVFLVVWFSSFVCLLLVIFKKQTNLEKTKKTRENQKNSRKPKKPRENQKNLEKTKKTKKNLEKTKKTTKNKKTFLRDSSSRQPSSARVPQECFFLFFFVFSRFFCFFGFLEFFWFSRGFLVFSKFFLVFLVFSRFFWFSRVFFGLRRLLICIFPWVVAEELSFLENGRRAAAFFLP